ncbi:MAG: substrate-binding domain-containing protein [Paracoccaceae bacterium]
MAALRVAEPRIAVEIVASDTSENLLFREADIAVRMYRPEQLDIISRHLGDMPLGLFASHSYLRRHGRPDGFEALKSHRFVGHDRNDTIIRGMRDVGWIVTRDWFMTRCDDQNTYWELVRAGCGLGFGLRALGGDDPDLVELPVPGVTLPVLPVWLAAHEAIRHSPRIRRVWDALAEGLQARMKPPA